MNHVQKQYSRWHASSLKTKFHMFIGTNMALAFFSITALYLFMHGLMGQTQKILENNDTSLAFQTQMEAEHKALQEWAAGQNQDVRKLLEQAAAVTDHRVAELPDQLQMIGLEQYQVTWSILNSYRVYSRERAALLDMDRETEEFARQLYKVYDMQSYLQQYGTRLTSLVMKEGSQKYQGEQQKFRWLPVHLTIAAFFALLAVSGTGRAMDRMFIEPVIGLSKDAGRIAANDFGGELPEHTDEDEMGELIAAFGKMKEATERHLETMKENSELQVQLEKVQLQMLKSQINPHFLFNTLNMISCMAQMEEADTTDQMILAMSRLFQYTLKSSEAVTPLTNEMKVVEDYLYLQKMRFDERLRYEIHMGEGTEYRMVPSFILQPLVENSVVHGIADQEEGGAVCVKSWMEDEKLWISVSDTGVGMEADVLAKLREGKLKPASGHGVGLGNIWKRIKIMYEDGVVKIDSVKGQGTTILIGFSDVKSETTL